ncbi:unnamed protein product [Cuscuta campestris]|uniref:Uncharacterized protein n=1 Tax=Cuscuta campestris TaxID=132261 RepID=A0A484MZV9_9ASTE|nr:unnamed protein product [Cuscuta campestris]
MELEQVTVGVRRVEVTVVVWVGSMGRVEGYRPISDEFALVSVPTESPLHPGCRIPAFSTMYSGLDTVLYQAPPTITDLGILSKFRNRYEAEIEEHNKIVSSPHMAISLGDVFSLLWRYPGWESKVFRLLSREHIGISSAWPPLMTEVPELCSWVAPPGFVTINCDASFAHRAVGAAFRTPEGRPLYLLHEAMPTDYSIVEQGELLGMIKALESCKEVLNICSQGGIKLEKGFVLQSDCLDMVRKVGARASVRRKGAGATLVNQLLQQATNLIRKIEEEDGKRVHVFYTRREWNQLADFLSVYGGMSYSSSTSEDEEEDEEDLVSATFKRIIADDKEGALFFRHEDYARLGKLYGVEISKRKRLPN